MSSKSFIEILEQQIRTDLRAEIEAEVRARYEGQPADGLRANRGAATSDSEATSLNSAWETWLLSHVGKTVFSRDTQARRSYSQRTPAGTASASRSTAGEAAGSSPRASFDASSSASAPSSQASAHRQQARKMVARSLEELCALELLRRHAQVEISDSFSEEELKRAWRRAAMKTHPDRFATADVQTKTRMAALFQELCEAYDLLRAPFDSGDSDSLAA